MKNRLLNVFNKVRENEILFSFESNENVLNAKIAYNEFGAYCVPLSSINRNAVKEVLSGNVYEPETLDFIRKNVGDGDIVHAGAFFGDFIPALSRFVKEKSIVWVFEPPAWPRKRTKLAICLITLLKGYQK